MIAKFLFTAFWNSGDTQLLLCQMNPLRKRKLEASMVREISSLIIRRRVKDDRIGLISVTGVELAPDLSRAQVRVSLFGDVEGNRQTWAALKSHKNFLQSHVSRNLRLRLTPRISFVNDNSIAEGDRLLQIIEEDLQSTVD